MLIERLPAVTSSRGRLPGWLRVVAVCVVALVGIGVALLAFNWPFTKEAMTRALEQATSRPVQIGQFRQSYFPPGCEAENVRVLEHGAGGVPLITIDKLLVQGSLIGMFTSPKRLAQVKLVGMHMQIPPKGPHGENAGVALNTGSGGKALSISKIVADGTLLEFLPAETGKKPYQLRVDGLVITGVGSGQPMSYKAKLTNTEPPGVIQSQGKFGPWYPEDPGRTAVSGVFTYQDVNLGVFGGISGTLQAKGKFEGPLRRIQAEGTTEVPGFRVSGSGNTVGLTVGFHAIVNGTNGDTYLDPADAHFLRTTVETQAAIEGHAGDQGKTATLVLSVPNGRVEDLLRLFVEDKTAPMTGAVSLEAKAVWPPGPSKFVEKIRLDIDFGIGRGRFTNSNTQGSIDNLSKSGQGESRKQEKEDPRTMLADLRGHVALRNGIARFSNVSFAVPQASAVVHGTYNLLNNRVELHGVLYTQGSISDATSGFKAVVAKLITPFLKKKHDVKIVPFKITGTMADATVSLD
ncbi:MAG TPA: AsmA-like C-terminal region-containing protein [Bryobacteraceae bacterium]